MKNLTNWRDLLVSDVEGSCIGTLRDVVLNTPDSLDHARIDTDGEIIVWEWFYIYAEGENPVSDTPRVRVDWKGFIELREKSLAERGGLSLLHS